MADIIHVIGHVNPDTAPPTTAVGNIILDAVGINANNNPITPERVWRVMKRGYNIFGG